MAFKFVFVRFLNQPFGARNLDSGVVFKKIAVHSQPTFSAVGTFVGFGVAFTIVAAGWDYSGNKCTAVVSHGTGTTARTYRCVEKSTGNGTESTKMSKSVPVLRNTIRVIRSGGWTNLTK